MPWSESRVDDRMKFIERLKSGRWSIQEVSQSFGISRKTAYKFVKRYRQFGPAGLADRSRARHSQSERTSAAIEQRVVRAARRYACWGPRKILAILKRRHPEVPWPAKSTVGTILKRHGLVKERGSRRSTLTIAQSPFEPVTQPNQVWCTDFKGWRLNGSDERIEPFVLSDVASRYALSTKLVSATDDATVWPIFRAAFYEYGLPDAIRSDRGTPFGSPGLAGLSRLSVRWLRLGIRPQLVRKPQQNGVIERFNLTVAIETMSPLAPTLSDQERVLERFRRRFNEVRPHEALNDRCPVEVYQRSPRRFTGELPEHEYPRHDVSRTVHNRGTVRFGNREFFLSETLAGERIGMTQVGHTHWAIQLGPYEVAIYDEQHHDVIPYHRPEWSHDE
jgi:putative transposase